MVAPGGFDLRASPISKENHVNDDAVHMPASAAPIGCSGLVHAMKTVVESLHARRIQPGEPLGDVQRLRREVYFHEQGQDREKSRRISDGLDGSGSVLVVEQERKAVATLRLHDFASTAVQVEYGNLFQADRFARAWPLQRLAVATRFAVQAEQRDPAVVELLLGETYRHAQENGIQFILVACEASLHGVFEQYGFREYLPPAVLPNGLALLRMVLVVDHQALLAGCDSPLLPLLRNAAAGKAAYEWLSRVFPDVE